MVVELVDVVDVVARLFQSESSQLLKSQHETLNSCEPTLRGIHTCLISLNDEPRILLINNLSFNLFHISTSK